MNALAALDFISYSGAQASGLVSVCADISSLPLDEQIAIREVRIINAGTNAIDYVFFRRFADDRSSQAAAYVIDNAAERLTETELAEIHRRAWLQGHAPLLYVAWETRIDILSCAGQPLFWQNGVTKYSPSVPSLPVAADISADLARFSANRLADGTFWEDPASATLADVDENAHARLIRAVTEADRELEGKDNPTLRRLLVIVILIKYLEDRGVFPGAQWFESYVQGAKCFFDVLDHGLPDQVYSLLSDLENRFNGDVFKLPEIRQLRLTRERLRHFATLVRADTLGRQQDFWKLFDFKYIPIEVISHLYQYFAQRDKGAIFTPPFVVSLMLDYAMPYREMSDGMRILDPTCGSGAFLVSAFRRLINRHRSRNAWNQLDVSELKALLRSSIFGVEIQKDALYLTSFNLALAICDALQPDIIWRDLKFEALISPNGNLRAGDFFAICHTLASEPFDLIIGNPPFKESLTTPGAKIAYATRRAGEHKAPAKQLAYLIARESLELLKDGGHLCLIQPSGFLYNSNTQTFRSHYIFASRLDAVLDFTSIRGMYIEADPKTIAILTTKTVPSDTHVIRHYTFRRTASAKQQLVFELDHYDRHLVPQAVAIRYPWVWRCNLLGGGRLFHFAARLSEIGTLAEYIRDEGWDYGEGFIAASAGKRSPAPWLTGQPLLPTEAFDEHGIDDSKCVGRTVEPTLFRSHYSPSRYMGPIVLFKENWTLPLAYRKEGFLAYKDKIIGISAPNGCGQRLAAFYSKLSKNKKLVRALACIFGTQILVGKTTAFLKSDIDSVPWPTEAEDWNLAAWEEILYNDIVDYIADYVRLGQESELLRQNANDSTLLDYSKVFVDSVGAIYKDVRCGSTQRSGSLILQSFHFGQETYSVLNSDQSDWIKDVVYGKLGHTLRTVRMLRIYQGNEVIVVKPDRLRYWIRSTALWDADETIKNLVDQGF